MPQYKNNNYYLAPHLILRSLREALFFGRGYPATKFPRLIIPQGTACPTCGATH